MSIYIVKNKDGFSLQIGHLVHMMDYVRFTTLRAVQDLSVEQLDYYYDSESNSIGALLAHIAAVEWFYQIYTFESREPSKKEWQPWSTAMNLGGKAMKEIKGNSLEYYTDLLGTVRQKTLEGFASRKDQWLYEEEPFRNKKLANHYFMWFHVFEDEINHRGQIRWLRKRLPKL
jgi:uncharacterized damage-inducible protein DinB